MTEKNIQETPIKDLTSKYADFLIFSQHDSEYVFNSEIGKKEDVNFVYLTLDRAKLLRYEYLPPDFLSSTDEQLEQIVLRAKSIAGNKIIVGQNRPQGELTPTAEEIYLARRFVEIGLRHGVTVLDYVLVNYFNYLSLKQVRYF